MAGFGDVFKGLIPGAGTAMQGQFTRDQYWANAAADEYNAAVKRKKAEAERTYGEYRAQEVLTAGNLTEEAVRRNARIQEGETAAAGAQSGTGTEGSNEDIERQNQVLDELDALNVRYGAVVTAHDTRQQAEMNAWDYEMGAKLDTQHAQTARTAGSEARKMGMVGGISQLFSKAVGYGMGG